MTSSRLLDWSSAQQQICALIAAHRSQMKIVLKTKDDIFFLPRWVEHHRKIVGEKSLVIFDNGSTNPAVLDFYAAGVAQHLSGPVDLQDQSAPDQTGSERRI